MENLRHIPNSVTRRFPKREKIKQIADTILKISSSWFPHGRDIYDHEWDVLVILDTCRADALAEISDEYDFLRVEPSIWSRGSATREWVAHTFTQSNLAEVQQTALVTANSSSRWGLLEEAEPDWPKFAQRLTRWDTVEPDDFLTFDEVWRYGPKNPYIETVMPYAVTDRAISNWRQQSPERMIVHYLRPHHPYGSNAVKDDRPLTDIEQNPWKALKQGTSKEKVWKAYLDDLRQGLDAVETLVENIDAENIVITADHGDSFGEYGIYSHPMLPIPSLRKVPWLQTQGRGVGDYEPSIERGVGESSDLEAEVEKQLEMLGYR